MKTFTYRRKSSPRPPEVPMEIVTNRAGRFLYDRAASEAKYIEADHAPAIFDPSRTAKIQNGAIQ